MSNAIRLPRGRVPLNPEKRSLYLGKAAKANKTTVAEIEKFLANGASSNAPYEPKHKFTSKPPKGQPSPQPLFRETYVEIIDGMNHKPLLLMLDNIIGARPLANGGVSILSTDDTGESSEIDSPESYESFKARLATVATVLAAPNIPMVENSSEPVEVVGSIESSGIIV